jgi:hypothetical protein
MRNATSSIRLFNDIPAHWRMDDQPKGDANVQSHAATPAAPAHALPRRFPE